ncbi:MAG: hypothetical protein UY48_C0006G0019 [Candidatus Gottesmanbacteria bacterium GW2011_GWB1_49_7]|uniref:Uncharacterized protein n=1 Tax=Candidatus Gottesmanbacteria bacterium GW2011_GWB1_49_7 TaxID=1618448 RepID=A0A0G1W2I0_9BACT|nr:MAG: hypothetical protein UY48_C0006G0019 [Candidatus Gottesmanbacteria bacterium GW2011_GWB1_49_7]
MKTFTISVTVTLSFDVIALNQEEAVVKGQKELNRFASRNDEDPVLAVSELLSPYFNTLDTPEINLWHITDETDGPGVSDDSDVEGK